MHRDVASALVHLEGGDFARRERDDEKIAAHGRPRRFELQRHGRQHVTRTTVVVQPHAVTHLHGFGEHSRLAVFGDDGQRRARRASGTLSREAKPAERDGFERVFLFEISKHAPSFAVRVVQDAPARARDGDVTPLRVHRRETHRPLSTQIFSGNDLLSQSNLSRGVGRDDEDSVVTDEKRRFLPGSVGGHARGHVNLRHGFRERVLEEFLPARRANDDEEREPTDAPRGGAQARADVRRLFVRLLARGHRRSHRGRASVVHGTHEQTPGFAPHAEPASTPRDGERSPVVGPRRVRHRTGFLRAEPPRAQPAHDARRRRVGRRRVLVHARLAVRRPERQPLGPSMKRRARRRTRKRVEPIPPRHRTVSINRHHPHRTALEPHHHRSRVRTPRHARRASVPRAFSRRRASSLLPPLPRHEHHPSSIRPDHHLLIIARHARRSLTVLQSHDAFDLAPSSPRLPVALARALDATRQHLSTLRHHRQRRRDRLLRRTHPRPFLRSTPRPSSVPILLSFVPRRRAFAPRRVRHARARVHLPHRHRRPVSRERGHARARTLERAQERALAVHARAARRARVVVERCR